MQHSHGTMLSEKMSKIWYFLLQHILLSSVRLDGDIYFMVMELET